ncbi:hypothetical protein JCM8097_002990 [Rhodosporidiobolus ruineniae]
MSLPPNCFDPWELFYNTDPVFRARADAAQAERERVEALFSSGNPFLITNLLPELIDEILSHVTSKPDLADCCLVSKALLPHAQRALYASVDFDFIEDGDHRGSYLLAPREEHLHRTLTTSPVLGSLVKSVSLCLQDNKYASYTAYRYRVNLAEVEDDEMYTLPPGWVEERKVDLPVVVHQILEKLPVVQQLELDFGPRKLPFLSGLVLTSVTSLKAYKLSPSLLRAFPSVSHLEVGIPVAFDPKLYPPPSALTSLHVVLRPGKSPYSPKKVVACFSFLLSNSTSSLEHLDLPFHPLFEFSLTSFLTLRHLRLDLTHGSKAPEGKEGQFPSFLETLPSSLESIEISDSSRANGEPVPLSDTYLAHLPASLTTASLSAGPFFPSTVLDFLRQIKQQLPRLKKLHWTRFGIEVGHTSYLWEPWSTEDIAEVHALVAAKGLKWTPVAKATRSCGCE